MEYVVFDSETGEVIKVCDSQFDAEMTVITLTDEYGPFYDWMAV